MRIQLPFGVPYEIVGHRPGQPVARDETNPAAAPAVRDYLPVKLRRVARPAWANENNFRAVPASDAAAVRRDTVGSSAQQSISSADAHHAGEPASGSVTSSVATPPTSQLSAQESLAQNLAALTAWANDGPLLELDERRQIAEQFAQCWTNPHVTKLDIKEKNSITSLPPLPPTVTELAVWMCARIETPPEVAGHPKLEMLSFVACDSLRKIPDASNCTKLKSYTVQDCDGIVEPQDLTGCSKVAEVGFLGCRNLRALPNISACPQLNWLDITDCRSLAGSVDLSANPHMKTLMMADCGRVEALNLAGCNQLETISMQHCPSLTTLPPLGHLQNLEYIQMRGTPVTSLPDDIVSLPSTCEVGLDASRLSDAVRNRLAHVMNSPDYAGPQIHYSMGQASSETIARSVGEEVDAWRAEALPHLQQAQTQFDWSTLPAHDNVKAFATFLVRVRETSDYRHGSAELKAATQQRMAVLLAQMQTDPTLRENCCNLAIDAIDTCGDRVALRMLDMENLAVASEAKTALNAGKFDHDPKALIDLCKGQHRLALIATEAENKVATMHFTDPVEVHLGYLVKLAEPYQLHVRISTMLYPACSGITDADIAAASKKLSNEASTAEESSANDHAYHQALAGSELMRGLLHRLQPAQMQAANADNAKLIEQAKNTLRDALDALNPNDENFVQQNRQLMAAFKSIEIEIPIKATLPVLQNFLQSQRLESGLGGATSVATVSR